MTENEGKLKQRMRRKMDELATSEGSDISIADLFDILQDTKREFPLTLPPNCFTVDQAIAFWEHEIQVLQTSPDDTRVLLSWMKADLEKLKWFREQFGS